jgi:hypothetical protein
VLAGKLVICGSAVVMVTVVPILAAVRASAHDRQVCSGRISIAPHGHSVMQMPQPLQ